VSRSRAIGAKRAWASLFDAIAYALREPPLMLLEIAGAVAVINPVVFAVVVQRWFVVDFGTCSASEGTVRIRVIN